MDLEKAFNKVQCPFMTRALKELGIEGTYLNFMKIIYDKSTSNNLLNEGKLRYFL